MEAGIDTSDANATASDILLNKTAYVNGVKLTGSLEISTITQAEYEEDLSLAQSILGGEL